MAERPMFGASAVFRDTNDHAPFYDKLS